MQRSQSGRNMITNISSLVVVWHMCSRITGHTESFGRFAVLGERGIRHSQKSRMKVMQHFSTFLDFFFFFELV